MKRERRKRKIRMDKKGGYKNLKNMIEELRQAIAWRSNQIYRRKIKRKATKKEKEILQKLREWLDQQLNRNEDLIYVK